MPAVICPLCHTPLTRDAKTWHCANGHSFDVAREGYVNLLPVQHKKSRAPGDNPAMVQARRAFLQAGHYQPLREVVVELLRPQAAQTLLDIGCGEGYYTESFREVAKDITGIDIAKPAVQLAARRLPGMTWLVASAAALPLATAETEVAVSLFSPLPPAELARVLKPGGHLLVATPGPRHLWSLRQALFDEVQAHQPDKFLHELSPLFELQAQREVQFPLGLTQESLRQLLLMTPYAWRAKPDKRAALEVATDFGTRAEFQLYLLRKRGYP